MPVVKDSLERRVEQLEAQCQRQQELIDSLVGREAQTTQKRAIYLAKTIKTDLEGYPLGGNEFGLQFIDRGFDGSTEYNQPYVAPTDHPRSASSQAVGMTLDGHYVAEGTVVAVSPLPPPPNAPSDQRGRYHILTTGLAIHWGITQGPLPFIQFGNVTRYVDSLTSVPLSITDSVYNPIKNVAADKQVVYVQWGTKFLLIQAQGWF